MAGVNEMPINDKLFLIQAEIIRKAAAEGPCVIVGRCADYILREHTDCLRVFIHADRDSRLRRAVEKYGVDPAKVSDFLTKRISSGPITTISTPTKSGTPCKIMT